MMRFLYAAFLLASSMLCCPQFAAARDLSPVKPVMDCSALAKMVLATPEAPGQIDTATVSSDGSATPYCDVKGFIAPQVRFEIRLPMNNWTQRLLFEGCGGFCGILRVAAPRVSEGCLPATNGEFVLASSDLGHEGGGAVWGASKELRDDFGYRGVHVTTIAAKEIVAKFYGQAQAYSYFDGCSDGGREAMMEVQRFPQDFNGVIAGAPAISEVANNTVYHSWIYQNLRRPGNTNLFSDAALATLHTAALAACKSVDDGKEKGVIADPTKCTFDPGVVACKGGETVDTCLTPEQVKAARAMYKGSQFPDGTVIYGGVFPGSEMGWNRQDAAGSSAPGGFPGYLASDPPDPKLEYSNLPFTPAAVKKYQVFGKELDATNPDLRAFQKTNGKVIIWQGFNDTAVSPVFTLQYVHEVRHAMGASTDSFLRVYMLPGVNHCGNGDGPDRIDALTAILDWVEDGKAPGALTATKKDAANNVLIQRDIQPYE